MVADDYQATADTIQYSKRMLGHSYMSSNVDMTSIAEAFAGVPVESFVMRAAAKAFRAAVDSDAEVNVSKVVAHGKRKLSSAVVATTTTPISNKEMRLQLMVVEYS